MSDSSRTPRMRLETGVTLEEDLVLKEQVILEQSRRIRELEGLILMQKLKIHRQHKELEEADLDPLTKVSSLLGYQKHAQALLKGESGVCVAWLDIDHLHDLNACYGTRRGTQAIVQMAAAIRRVVQGYGTICRVGGDDFIVVFENLTARRALDLFRTDPNDYARLAFDAELTWTDRTGQVIRREIQPITAKGAITNHVPGESLEMTDAGAGVFERLSYGLQRAKKAGGNRIQMVSPRTDMSDDILERRQFLITR